MNCHSIQPFESSINEVGTFWLQQLGVRHRMLARLLLIMLVTGASCLLMGELQAQIQSNVVPASVAAGRFRSTSKPAVTRQDRSTLPLTAPETDPGAAVTATRQNDLPVAQNSDLTLDLNSLEQMAFAASPVISKIQSRIEALQGKRIQAGLPPNPTVGIMGEDIFEDGNGGRFGVYFGQQVVRGNKLGLSQQVVTAEIAAAQRELESMGNRVLNDTRTRFYNALLAERKVEFASTLVDMLREIVRVSAALVEAREVARTALLQSEIELEKAVVVLQQAKNERTAALGSLAGLINQPSIPVGALQGDLMQLPELDSIEQAYDRILEQSPEIALLLARVETAQRRVQRACVQAIPNVTWQSGVSYDTASDDVVASFQVGMPLPTVNLNQGAISQAQQNVRVAQREVEQKVLQIRQRLIREFRIYNEAKIQVEAFRASILPKSKETLELSTAAYEQGEVGFLNLLTVQRTYFQAQLDFLERLKQMRRQMVLIEGNLIDDALSQQ